MTAPLIQRLEAEIRATTDGVLQAELYAQVACYQARVGEFEEAERIRARVRSVYGDGRSPQVSIRIMCAEGLLLYYKGLDPSARDRLFRANLLSAALSLPNLVALTSAWLAHVDFNAGRFEAMAKSAASCLAVLYADDGSADCRIGLVLGDAFAYVGDEKVSKRWYERARRLANRLGDHAAVGALTYNRAVLHLARARIDALSGRLDNSRIGLIVTEVQSAVNYQAVAQLSSLDHLLRSASASSLLLEERYSDATTAILKLIASTEVPTGSAELALLYSDNAFCLAELGQWQMATEMAAAGAAIDSSGFDFDDRALIFDSLSKYHLLAGESERALKYRDQADLSLTKHRESLASLATLLEPFVTDATPRT